MEPLLCPDRNVVSVYSTLCLPPPTVLIGLDLNTLCNRGWLWNSKQLWPVCRHPWSSYKLSSLSIPGIGANWTDKRQSAVCYPDRILERFLSHYFTDAQTNKWSSWLILPKMSMVVIQFLTRLENGISHLYSKVWHEGKKKSKQKQLWQLLNFLFLQLELHNEPIKWGLCSVAEKTLTEQIDCD